MDLKKKFSDKIEKAVEKGNSMVSSIRKVGSLTIGASNSNVRKLSNALFRSESQNNEPKYMEALPVVPKLSDQMKKVNKTHGIHQDPTAKNPYHKRLTRAERKEMKKKLEEERLAMQPHEVELRQIAIVSAIRGMANALDGREIDHKALEPLVIEICKARRKFQRQMDAVNLDEEPLFEDKLILIRGMAVPLYVKEMLRAYYKVKFLQMDRSFLENILIHASSIIRRLPLNKWMYIPYQATLRIIEGQFNFSVASYFRFLRWLMALNLFTLLVPLTLIIYPLSTSDQVPFDDILQYKNIKLKDVTLSKLVTNCSVLFSNSITTSNTDNYATLVINNIQGYGTIEMSYLFYGGLRPAYTKNDSQYSISGYYVLSIILSFCVALVAIVVKRLMLKTYDSIDNRRCKYSELVLGTWNHTITNNDAIEINMKATQNSIVIFLSKDREEHRQRMLNNTHYRTLFTIRCMIHVTVLIILIVTIVISYTVTSWSNTEDESNSVFMYTMYSYIPPITLSLINMYVPVIYGYLMTYEDYDGTTQLFNTLIRILTLRLTTLFFYLLAVVNKVKCNSYDECNIQSGENCTKLVCWESHVYRVLHQLGVVDICIVLIKSLVMDPLKRMYIDQLETTWLTRTTFNTPVRLCHVVYHQILCWIGILFSPLTCLSAIIRLLVLFHVYKFNLLNNLQTSKYAYENITPHLQITKILMIGYVFSLSPVIYTLSKWRPSRSCGNFRFSNSVIESFGITEGIAEKFESKLMITFLTLLTSCGVISLFLFISKSNVEESSIEIETNLKKKVPQIKFVPKNKKKKNKRPTVFNKPNANEGVANLSTRAPWDERLLDQMNISLTVVAEQKPHKHFLDISYLFASSDSDNDQQQPQQQPKTENNDVLSAFSGNLYKAFSDVIGIGEAEEKPKKKKATKKIYDVFD